MYIFKGNDCEELGGDKERSKMEKEITGGIIEFDHSQSLGRRDW